MTNETEKPKLNIYQRLNEVKKSVSYLKKDQKIQGYTAISHDKVTTETRQHFIDAGVLITISLKKGKTIELGATRNGALQRMYDAIYLVEFINIDEPADKLTVKVPAQGLDTSDKAIGKSLSMGMKMAILKVLQIASGDQEEDREDVYPVQQQSTVNDNDVLRAHVINEIHNLSDYAGKPVADIVQAYGVSSLNEIHINQLNKIKKRLTDLIEQNDAREDDNE